MRHCDRLAILLAISSIFIVRLVTIQIYGGIPHIEDETAYIWQAQAAARNQLTISSPSCPECFLVPFVVDYHGERFGKFPPGWPAVLSLAIRLNIRSWINPLLAGLSIWLTYRLLSRLAGKITALLAALLTLSSPFFLLNAGTLLAHIWSFFLTLAFILAWFDLTKPKDHLPRWMPILLAGFSLGLLVLTRPWSALAIALPFFIHGIYLLVRAPTPIRVNVFVTGIVAFVIGSLLVLWQFAVTGDPWLNPYTLWWPYDRIGFGPGRGLQENGHSLVWAIHHTRFSLRAGLSDLFGWARFSWLFMPFGLIALYRKLNAWLIMAIAPSLIFFYLFYWIGSWVYGPRYYFEGIVSVSLLTASGIVWLAGKLPSQSAPKWRFTFAHARFISISALALFLLGANIMYYLPARLGMMVNLGTASSSQLSPFQSASASEYTPALVIVHRQGDWREYGTLLELSNPFLDSPFVFIRDQGEELNNKAISSLPQRKVWHYYADTPNLLYTSPRE